MAQATFRFYAELNDLLPWQSRQRDIVHAFREPASIKDRIEAHGVPHTEVELIQINGEPVDFARPLQDGNRVSVYPFLAILENPRPLRPPYPRGRFVLDQHLGRLAAYLRLLGLDCVHRARFDDDDLARVAVDEDRVLLSRDRRLLMRRAIVHGGFVRATDPMEQVPEVLHRFGAPETVAPFTRCMACNGVLRPAAREQVEDRLQPDTREVLQRVQGVPRVPPRCSGTGRTSAGCARGWTRGWRRETRERGAGGSSPSFRRPGLWPAAPGTRRWQRLPHAAAARVAVSAKSDCAKARTPLNQAESAPPRSVVPWHATCETTMYDAARAEGAAVRSAGDVRRPREAPRQPRGGDCRRRTARLAAARAAARRRRGRHRRPSGSAVSPGQGRAGRMADSVRARNPPGPGRRGSRLGRLAQDAHAAPPGDCLLRPRARLDLRDSLAVHGAARSREEARDLRARGRRRTPG